MAEIKEDDRDEILEQIFAGAITIRSLPPGLFQALADTLRGAVFEGFGGRPNDFVTSTETHRIVRDIDDNVRVFSAAKTFQQVKEMSAEVEDPFGRKRKFEDFKKKAGEIFERYNETWLKAEQDTAFAQSQSARDWARIEENKGMFPMLTYQTQGDDRVRPEHQRLDGITRPVDDSFWDTYMPPNGWRCRCRKPRQSRSAQSSDIRGAPEPEPLFKMNPGKDRFAFKEDVGDGLEHPYFKVEERYEVLKEQGFGLL